MIWSRGYYKVPFHALPHGPTYLHSLRNTLSQSITEPSPSVEAALHLFFSGLVIVLSGRLPPNSPISSTLINALHKIGQRYVRDNSNQQKRLLHTIVFCSSLPPGTKRPQEGPLPPPQSATGAAIPPPMGVVGVTPTAMTKRFDENRATLFDLFTPNCLLTQLPNDG